MDNKLTIGIPNKGRLQKETEDILAKSNLKISRSKGNRDYTGKIVEIEGAEVIFLSPKEIVMELNKGSIDLGITGLDLIQENIFKSDESVFNIIELGFGHADVVIAVPQTWIDVSSISDLDDVIYNFRLKEKRRLRIATKYKNISRNFFSKINLSDYILVDSHGATEGAPAYGSSEIIIDITSTGSTLAANQLKRLDNGTILKSQACIFGSLMANWTQSKINKYLQLFKAISSTLGTDIEAKNKFLNKLSKKKPL
tara:strand:- start:18642 stop:19406 length:765 start_codon:yes stop_codon:yes gene_type:complete